MRHLKVLKNKTGDILAGYTYSFRTNKLDQKSMYIDSLTRNKSENFNTKTIMSKIFLNIKNSAKASKTSELTLFVFAKDKKLRDYYSKLGFNIDNKCDVKKLYLMRTPIENFLNSRFIKSKIYANALGVNSILKTKRNFQ